MQTAPTLAGLLISMALTTGCGESAQALDRLARAGRIHEGAPVTAEVEMQIAASCSRVWALLVDASSWPKWNHQIEKVAAPGQLASGTRFDWITGGTTIRSQVQLFDPERRLGWTGTAFTAKAIHIWELRPAGEGQTSVTVKESMDGPLMKHLFPSRKLVQTDTDWLLSCPVGSAIRTVLAFRLMDPLVVTEDLRIPRILPVPIRPPRSRTTNGRVPIPPCSGSLQATR